MQLKFRNSKVTDLRRSHLKNIALLIGISFLLSACTPFNLFGTGSEQYSTNDPNTDLNNPYIPYTDPIILPATIVLAPGFSANFSNGVALSFLAVRDSRCPSGASCIQAGEASVDLQLIYNNQAQVRTLNTSSQPNSFLFQGLNIQLHEIRPYPVLNRQTNQNDFRIIVHAVEQ